MEDPTRAVALMLIALGLACIALGWAIYVAASRIERYTEADATITLKLLEAGHPGFAKVTEAVTTEYGALMGLVRQALRDRMRLLPGMADCWPDIEGIWPDRVVACCNGRTYSFSYGINADNTVTIGDPTEVVASYLPVREAVASANGWSVRESADGGLAIDVTLIRAGLSKNGNYYPDSTLQDAVGLFEGARVFSKPDAVHSAGGGKDVSSLLGGVYGVRFIAGSGPDSGALVATFRPIDPTDATVVKMAEAVRRGMANLMGLSIDALAKTKREQRDGKTVRVAQKFTRVNSVDLIVEPGAGGGLDRLAEAAATEFPTTTPSGETMFKKTYVLAAVAALALAAPAAGVAQLTESTPDVQLLPSLQAACRAVGVDPMAVLTVLTEAADEAAVTAGVTRLVAAAKGGSQQTQITEASQVLTRADLDMFRIRGAAAVKVAGCSLPAPAKQRIQAGLDARERFTEADVDAAIKAERDYLAQFTESGTVRVGLGQIEVGDRSKAIADMLDAFFDPTHKNHRNVQSFKECYIAITGDKRVTGQLRDCDVGLLRESLGDTHLAEAVSSSTFANVLGDSVTRRMLAIYGQQTDLQAWRKVATAVPVNDFRAQQRTQMGGYGNLPTVAQGAGYTALTSPGDLVANYTVTKRGGLETVTLEAIKNDDVGAIRRIPGELALAAANTLYEFVMDFFRTNPNIYDSAALYTVGRGNLFTVALSAAEYATHRLAMAKQTRLSSAKRRGVTPSVVLVPYDLQETAYNLFVRNQNLDKTFVQTINPEVIPVAYWTDTNDWVTVASPMDLPVLEVGFLDGKEEPELFVQDMPNVGSLFSNDQVTWKIRHIYSGAVLPEGDKGTTKAVVP